MSQMLELVNFIEYENGKKFIIEPDVRRDLVKERIFKSLKTFNPKIIVKAGIGAGDLLLDIATKIEGNLIVVEPSFDLISKFLNENEGNKVLKKIQFIGGVFDRFPIDYFIVDMIICVDYFDFVDSAVVIDEFKRAMDVDGVFFFAGVVLNKSDIEGIYDDFIHLIDPYHNDYYLPNDFKTFMELKEFTTIHGGINQFKRNINDIISYWEEYNEKQGIEKINKDEIEKYLKENKQIFVDLYKMDDQNNFSESYLTAEFRRNKIEKIPPSVK
jgi:hypothetical protein